MPDTETTISIACLLAGAALASSMIWLERRPRRGLELRLWPTTPFLFTGVLVAVLALVHLLNLWGIKTGRN